jgi:N-acyl homoserine lactone hydrolase
MTAVPKFYVRELSTCGRLRRVQAGDEVLPGLTAHATPGHTPGHLIYVLSSREQDVIFTGDAAKNRAELIGRKADLTLDAAASSASIDYIWDLWQRRPGSVLIPGHDVPMVVRDGRPQYIGRQRAAIAAWFGGTIKETHDFELSLA